MISRAALSSLSARLGGASSSRAAFFAARATTTTPADGLPRKGEEVPPSSGPGGGRGTAVHPAPPAPTNKEPLDVEREREEVRRHARGGATDPGIDEEKMRVDPGAERGPVAKSLHTAKGKIKEAVGSVAEKVSHAFTAEGKVGHQFEPEGAVGGTIDKVVGGPFSADGAVGRQFRSDGAVGGTVEAAAEAGEESGEHIKEAGKKEKETKK